MKSTVVLKFGGSSCADNIKLNIVAKKIIEFYEKNNNVVVIISAQGKTTDKLISEAKELSDIPDEREMDVLLSAGEQMSMSKISILLNKLGYKTVSLTGWQAGIHTTGKYQDSKIDFIDTNRIKKELENNKIVIIAGFQGINDNLDITTLGRGGSDTSAVAVAAALSADKCYIFSDVDGIYSADPHKVTNTKKLENISYEEMLDISSEGAKVLHNRCIEVGKKFHIPIIAKSTFNNEEGTTVQEKIEDTSIKSIVKNDNIILVNIQNSSVIYKIINLCILNGIIIQNTISNINSSKDFSFTVKKDNLEKLIDLIKNNYPDIKFSCIEVTRIAVIGFGILNDNNILKETMNLLSEDSNEIVFMEVNESKIAVLVKGKLPDTILEKLHKKLIQ